MKVYKFGGASVRNADGVRNLHKIIGEEQQLFIIVSAMGKTTNALEKVFQGVQQGDRAAAQEHIDGLKRYHAEIIDDLWHGPTHLPRVDAFSASWSASPPRLFIGPRMPSCGTIRSSLSAS